MGFFNFIKQKVQHNNDQKVENYQDIENEYLSVKEKDNIYGFQEKFYMQSNRLLKVFGNARSALPNKKNY